MLQLKPIRHSSKINFLLIALFLFSVWCHKSIVLGQGYDDTFEMKNKIKLELQYSDYWEYEYPEPILFRFGVQDYQQNQPYIANFPEKRALVKFTRMVGSNTALSTKYQYSDIRDDIDQHMGELKVTKTLSSSLIGLAGVQWIRDTRGFDAYQPGMGFRWDAGPLTILQADVQYYARGSDAVDVGGQMGSLNLRFKIRQVLTISTALFVEYLLYDASGENIEFTSHTGSVWLSQWLPTQTAVHLNLRYYNNDIGISSWAPSLEIAQYINWATVFKAKYRYYTNQSENVSLGEEEVIIPDDLESHTISVQLNREVNPDLLIYGKYRYYQSNLDIKMNTYMFGFVYSF